MHQQRWWKSRHNYLSSSCNGNESIDLFTRSFEFSNALLNCLIVLSKSIRSSSRTRIQAASFFITAVLMRQKLVAKSTKSTFGYFVTDFILQNKNDENIIIEIIWSYSRCYLEMLSSFLTSMISGVTSDFQSKLGWISRIISSTTAFTCCFLLFNGIIAVEQTTISWIQL